MRTVLDLNAALGQMWTAMDDSKFEVSYLGLDWAPNIMDIVGQTFPLIDGSESHVVPPLCWANPSVPFDLGKSFDFVISIVSGGGSSSRKEGRGGTSIISLGRRGIPSSLLGGRTWMLWRR